jgi:hypothetical protein
MGDFFSTTQRNKKWLNLSFHGMMWLVWKPSFLSGKPWFFDIQQTQPTCNQTSKVSNIPFTSMNIYIGCHIMAPILRFYLSATYKTHWRHPKNLIFRKMRMWFTCVGIVTAPKHSHQYHSNVDELQFISRIPFWW